MTLMVESKPNFLLALIDFVPCAFKQGLFGVPKSQQLFNK